MDLSLSDEQEQLRSSFRSLFDRECDVDCVRSAEPLGFAPELWKRVVELGAADMAVPEVAGGAGATLLDAAVICETVGEFVAPVPVVETIVANRLLARLGTDLALVTLSDAIDLGSVMTVALSRPIDGELRWVPAGAVAEGVIVADGERLLVLTDRPPERAVANLASLPLAHRSAHGAQVVATGAHAAAAFRAAVDEWRVLTAAVLWGAGRRALDIAIAYAKERKAFGVPIATYQSVAHRMADLATALEGSRLLNRKAAWAADGQPDQAGRLALMAYAFAGETAEQAATDSLHFHGGYGFMLEYDIQLYFRRIKGWSLLNGDPRRELQRLADVMWGPPG